MRRTAILALAAITGCATLQGGDAPDPEARFERALAALERQDFPGAYDQLARVYAEAWGGPLAGRALLAMAAVELDPRNGGRRLDVGADLAARHFQHAGHPGWTTPVSQTLYLLAQELGATEARAARAEAEKARAEAEREEARRVAERAEAEKAEAERERQAARAQASRATAQARAARAQASRAEARAAARPLPSYQGPSVSARVRELSGERDRLRSEVAVLKRRLAEREQELERIRATLTSPGGG